MYVDDAEQDAAQRNGLTRARAHGQSPRRAMPRPGDDAIYIYPCAPDEGEDDLAIERGGEPQPSFWHSGDTPRTWYFENYRLSGLGGTHWK